MYARVTTNALVVDEKDTHMELCRSEHAGDALKLCTECGEDSECFASWGDDSGYLCEACCVAACCVADEGGKVHVWGGTYYADPHHGNEDVTLVGTRGEAQAYVDSMTRKGFPMSLDVLILGPIAVDDMVPHEVAGECVWGRRKQSTGRW